MSKAVKKAPKKKNGYQMPDPIPNGEVLQDITKKKWIIGPSIGVGGFGEIYSASEYNDKKPTNYSYVVKIEPHGNGPLFVEMHFYMRNAKADDIDAWRSKKKFKTFGMPKYVGSGSHECNGTKYRFVVMEKFGKDLWKIFLENDKHFPTQTALQIGIQMLDVLEYIHSKGYVHADIKGQNALLGLSKNNENQVYLVDFGLAAHYSTKDFKPDPKKAHNGTIEYTSRDAHSGVPTRRGDLEIVAYNLIHWLGGILPWDKNLTDPVAVHNAKIKFMDSVGDSLKACFKNKELPDALQKFLLYVSKMQYDTEPDYAKCRSILVSGVESLGHSVNGPLSFSSRVKSPKRKSTNTVNAHKDTPDKKRKVIKKTIKKKTKELSDEEEEKPMNSSKENENDENEPIANGFTAEMLRVKKRMEENKKSKPKAKKVALKSSSSSGSSKKESIDVSDTEIIECTPTPPKNSRKKAIKLTKRSVDVTPTRSSARSKQNVFYADDSE